MAVTHHPCSPSDSTAVLLLFLGLVLVVEFYFGLEEKIWLLLEPSKLPETRLTLALYEEAMGRNSVVILS